MLIWCLRAWYATICPVSSAPPNKKILQTGLIVSLNDAACQFIQWLEKNDVKVVDNSLLQLAMIWLRIDGCLATT